MEEKMVMYASDEAATYKTGIEGWVSRDGRFWGTDEHMARWSGCTHQLCECGKPKSKSWIRCDSCRATQKTEKYYSLPMVEWDGDTPICVYDDDRYFFDKGYVLDWMADLEEGAEVQLVLCKPHKLHLIDADIWSDDLPEDGEIPDAVALKLAELNDAIKNAPIACWYPDNKRIDVDKLWEQLKREAAQ